MFLLGAIALILALEASFVGGYRALLRMIYFSSGPCLLSFEAYIMDVANLS